MAEPWIFNVLDPQEQIFTFSNGQVTFTVDTQFDPTQLPPESVTVQSVKIDTPGHSGDLGITNVEVPPPVIEHISGHFPQGHFDLLI
jgi:hypothetical protein